MMRSSTKWLSLANQARGLPLVAPFSAAAPAHAGGVVTVCNEAHLLAALAGGGTVTFACSGTITLSNTIVIAADTTIDGSGQDVSISGNDAVRVFEVTPGLTLSLENISVANGKATDDCGGGILNSGSLIASNSTFAGNSADCGGAIANMWGMIRLSSANRRSEVNSLARGMSDVTESATHSG